MSALYPDVPTTLGVPPVLRQVGSYIDAEVSALRTQSLDSIQTAAWGIYGSGGLVIEPDNIRALSFVGEYRVPDYPVENGDFRSYNKVKTPFGVRIAMTKGGSVDDKTGFLFALESLRQSLDLVSVVTPEQTYVDVNVIRVTYDRSTDYGAGLLTVEIILQEIRQTASITYSQAKAVPGDDTSSGTSSDASSSPTTPVAPALQAKRATNITNPFAKAATKNPASASPINRGAIQGARPINGFLPRAITTASGARVYTYDVKAGG